MQIFQNKNKLVFSLCAAARVITYLFTLSSDVVPVVPPSVRASVMVTTDAAEEVLEE